MEIGRADVISGREKLFPGRAINWLLYVGVQMFFNFVENRITSERTRDACTQIAVAITVTTGL